MPGPSTYDSSNSEELQFPAPRYPRFHPITRSEVEKRIMKWVFETSSPSKQKRPAGGNFPIYSLGKGDKVLLVSATEYDSEVMMAYAKAFRERGAKVDVLMMQLDALPPSECAEEEARTLIVGIDNPCYTSFCNVISGHSAIALVNEEQYSAIVGGTAGPIPPNVPAKWLRTPFVTIEEVAGSLLDFPFDLQIAIDKKVYSQIMSLEKARMTDPEGTDISWTNYDDGREMIISHEMGKPVNIGYRGTADCNGVIAGTLNHMGAFPHVRALIKDDLVTKVEGGGNYGDLWQEKIEDLNKIQMPTLPLCLAGDTQQKFKLPGPGFFWFWEMAIGTTVGAFRSRREMEMRNYANFLHDRQRAGYVHNGFGALAPAALECTKANIPWTHVHIHLQFATFEGRMKDGTEVKIIDKGHLTALDDPEIRQVAAEYGDPDVLLSEKWIPAVPGINAAGDYFEDYAKNPLGWLKADSVNYSQAEVV